MKNSRLLRRFASRNDILGCGSAALCLCGLAALVLSVVLSLAGCVRPTTRPGLSTPLPTQQPVVTPGIPESKLAPQRKLPLKGRRVVIDPGHGGAQPGTSGPTGIREADVNLGVALYLWGLLDAAGAEVKLTRTSDTSVARDEDASLAEDLTRRAQIASEFKADLFLSIHHNADVKRGSARNDLEVYYKLEDDGPSLDAAQCLIRSLAELRASLQDDAALSSGEIKKRIMPGNYRVLREATVPAVLAECSYLSNADNARKLRSFDVQRAEAEALFSGILDYFSRGLPSIELLEFREKITSGPQPLLEARLRGGRNADLDPASITVLIDGDRVRHLYHDSNDLLQVFPPAVLVNGTHSITVKARNVRGNALKPFEAQFAVENPPRRLVVTCTPDAVRPDGLSKSLVSALVLDQGLNPVFDGTEVRFEASAGVLSSALVHTVAGRASTTLEPPLDVSAVSITATSGEFTGDSSLRVEKEASPMVAVRVRDAGSGAGLAGVSVGNYGLTAPDGSYFFQPGRSTRIESVPIAKPGYVTGILELELPLAASMAEEVALEPVARGVLWGKRISLDPGYGGNEPGAIGPSGYRAADVNLRVAQYLAEFLIASGASVTLTRTADEQVTLYERVRRGGSKSADLFISIDHGGPTSKEESGGRQHAVLDDSGREMEASLADVTYCAHYLGSKLGKTLAEKVAQYLAPLTGVRSLGPVPGAAYVLGNTPCPAIQVHAFEPVDVGLENKLREPCYQQREAYAIYCALLEYFGLSPTETAVIDGVVTDAAETPIDSALAILDGCLTLQTDQEGRFLMRFLTPGSHNLRVRKRGFEPAGPTLSVAAGDEQTLRVMLHETDQSQPSANYY